MARLRRRQGGPPGPPVRRRRVHDAQVEGRRRRRSRTSAGWGSPATQRASGRASPSTPTSGGESVKRSTGWRNWRSSTRTGSRSRPHPMTCSATSPSVEQCTRYGSPRASTSRTGSIFKQLLQAEAIDVVQIDACRVGGVNENLAILLLAAKFGVPVCPHAGGVGLCEMVQHLAMFDFIAVSGTTDGSMDRVRRSPARALHRPRRRARRAIPRSDRSRRRRPPPRRLSRRVPLPRRPGMESRRCRQCTLMISFVFESWLKPTSCRERHETGPNRRTGTRAAVVLARTALCSTPPKWSATTTRRSGTAASLRCASRLMQEH